jgi:monofunctional biosynthetic peptidoglycan transglycosylase
MSRGTAIARRVAIGVLAALGGFAIFEWATWPDVAALARTMPPTTAFVERFRERQREAGKSDRVAWTPVAYARIAADLKVATLVSEDIDFFSHDGFAVAEMKKALTDAWAEGEAPRGASTITQQLAKNLWLSPTRNPWRKVKEALLTRALERHLEKRRILELYLNVAEFGPGIYGAEAAARRYYGVAAAALSAQQSAALAGSLPKPSKWHPGAASRVYLSRVARILRRMDKARWLYGEI